MKEFVSTFVSYTDLFGVSSIATLLDYPNKHVPAQAGIG
jgi:hypothetical protein